MPGRTTGRMRESERGGKVAHVRMLMDRSPFLSDSRIANTCGVSREMVFAIRSREMGADRGVGTHGDPLMFSTDEMERLDGWLRDRGLLEEWE